MTEERHEQLKGGWTPYKVQKQRWVCKPHRPEEEVDQDRIESDDFRAGAKAMFDGLRTMTANHFHGDPEKDKLCQQENELFEEWIEDALEMISPRDVKKWRSLNDMYKLGYDAGSTR